MANPETPNEIRYKVKPTAPHTHLSDAAMTTLFHTHISLAMNSANLVWQRFNIMVVANAIIFGFLLCSAWFGLIYSEWKYFDRWMELSRRFTFPSLLPAEANPHRDIDSRRVATAGCSRRIAYLVIFLFFSAYAFLLIRFCVSKAC